MTDYTSFNCTLPSGHLCGRIFNPQAMDTPILIVAGGPGLAFDYLVPIAEQLSNHPTVFFNPIGVGQSEAFYGTEQWTLEQFTQEIATIVDFLSLDAYYLLAHSSGTIPAANFSISNSPKLQGLILVSPVLSLSRYINHMRMLTEQFPPHYGNLLRNHMDGKAVETRELNQALMYYYEKHMFRHPVWPEILLNVSAGLNKKMHQYLWGTDDFNVIGSWKNLELLNPATKYKTKSLILCGESDFIGESLCSQYLPFFSDVRFEVIENASHNPHLEAPTQFEQCIKRFIYETS